MDKLCQHLSEHSVYSTYNFQVFYSSGKALKHYCIVFSVFMF